MSAADAILAECIVHPDDDAPRLVWADPIGGERGELALLERGTMCEVCNICSGRGISIAGVIELYAALTGITPTSVTDPARVRPVENVLGSQESLRGFTRSLVI